MISKFKSAQLVFLDGKKPVKIRRVLRKDDEYEYEIRETGEVVKEERLSLLKK